MTVSRRKFLKTIGLAGGALALGGCPRAEEAVITDSAPAGWPGYARLEEEGKLQERVERAYAELENCRLCPRLCGVNRRAGEKGFCESTALARVNSHSAHFGEELPLVGRNGSGTIFFSNCNLRCVFCQNYPIAHFGRGRDVSDEDLASMMLALQRRGCHNINLVTPTHLLPNILGAVRIAHSRGLKLPLCYNTGGYDSLEMIRLLDGIVDIYLPDMKFMDPEKAARYAVAGPLDYPETAMAAIEEMHRQVGVLETDGRGVARRGLMIRHLVMPNRVSGAREFVRWVAEKLSKDTYVNIMAQYRVEYRAFEYPKIARAITPAEFVEAIDWAEEAGLTNLDRRSLAQARLHRRR